jgi:hypothetical protein
MNFSDRSSFVQVAVTTVLVAVVTVAGWPITTRSQEPGFLECLYAGPGDSRRDESRSFRPTQHHDDCVKDVLGVSELDEVVAAERMFGLPSDQITFIGCAAAPFLTYPASTDPPFRVKIYYPVAPNSDLKKYVAPILHEIGHAFQYRQAGSTQKLLASLNNSIERIELGADFLAGLAAKRLKMSPGEFETSFYLVGNYAYDPESHGNPTDRALAFRYGYNSPQTKQFEDSQYADFQDNGFAIVKHMGAPR